MKNNNLIYLFKETFKSWSDDKVPRLAAALSYYTVFSLAPLLLIIISILGFVYGTSSAKHQIISQIQSVVGKQSASFITTILEARNSPSSSGISSIIGIVTLLLGASGIFSQLKDSFNEIWHIEPTKKNLITAVKDNFLSFSMILGIGFLLLVSLVISTVISVVGTYFKDILPFSAFFLQLLNIVLSLGVITVLFASMYRVLPDTKIRWGDVWIGGIFTAILFTLGKYVLGWYLAHSAGVSKYGAAGSLILILLWVYYSAQILFFGAEFTKVYSHRKGSRAEPQRKRIKQKKKARIVESFLKGMALGAVNKTPKEHLKK